MQSGFKVLKYHNCSVQVNEMTRYQVPKEETSINLTNISEQVYCRIAVIIRELLGKELTEDGPFLLKQINGMEMAEARHETAVTLLTKCKEIDLVVLRESMVIEHHEPLVSKYSSQFMLCSAPQCTCTVADKWLYCGINSVYIAYISTRYPDF